MTIINIRIIIVLCGITKSRPAAVVGLSVVSYVK